MTGDEVQPVVRSKWRFLVFGAAGIGLTTWLIMGGFVEGLVSGCIAAVPGVLGINLLVMGLKRSR